MSFQVDPFEVVTFDGLKRKSQSGILAISLNPNILEIKMEASLESYENGRRWQLALAYLNEKNLLRFQLWWSKGLLTVDGISRITRSNMSPKEANLTIFLLLKSAYTRAQDGLDLDGSDHKHLIAVVRALREVGVNPVPPFGLVTFLLGLFRGEIEQLARILSSDI